MFGKKGGWRGGSFCHRQGSVICRASCICADMCVAAHQRTRRCAWLHVALCGGSRSPGMQVGRWDCRRGVRAVIHGSSWGAASVGCLGIVHPFLQQVAVRVCAVYGCERDSGCAKTGVCGLRSAYVSAEGSSGGCTAGRRVKPSCEASSIPIGRRRETRR